MTERRRYGRVRAQGVRSNIGPVLDLSPGGLRVLSRRRVRGRVDLVLSNEAGTRFNIRAEVIWHRRLRRRAHLIGFEFVDLSAEQLQTLAQLRAPAPSRASSTTPRPSRLSSRRSGIGFVICGLLLLLLGAAWSVASRTGRLGVLDNLPITPRTILIGEATTVFGGCICTVIGGLLLLLSRPRSRPAGSRNRSLTDEVRQLQTTQRFLNSLLESSLSGVVVVEAVRDDEQQIVDFEFRLVNAAAEQLLGKSAEVLVGHRMLSCLPCLKAEGLFDRAVSVIETDLPLREDRQFRYDKRWYQYSAVRLGDGLAVTFADISDLRQNEQKLRHAADHDALTGLANRKLFGEYLDKAIYRSRRNPDYQFAVLFLDFDRFKIVNDSLGHEAGDQLLMGIAARLHENLRAVDTASRIDEIGHLPARLGGDEFVVLLDGVEHPDDAAAVAKRLLGQFSEPHTIAGHEVISTASIGIVNNDPRYERADDMLRDADIAMYHAKAAGRARYVVFDEHMHQAVVDRMTLEKELRQAVEAMAFALHYEPIVSLATGRLVGFEALVRWQHPTRGLLPPREFITVAEELQLISPIGQWVMAEACCQLKQWQDRYPERDDLFVSVNLSRQQVFDPDFVQSIEQIIEETRIDPTALRLEITESVVVNDIAAMSEVLEQVRALGVRFAMDDFGTGHSSLNCLHRLPLDVLKIDRTFISGASSKSQYGAILHAIVELAFNLDMQVIAEGVENDDQLTLLQGLGCEFAQGWLFSGPVESDVADRFLDQDQPFSRAA